MHERAEWMLTGFALACVLINITLVLIALNDYRRDY